MKVFLKTLIIIVLIGCASSKNSNNGIIDPGHMFYNEMYGLIYKIKVDTSNIKAVKIYSFSFNKNGKQKDSSLIAYENLNKKWFSHTTFEIKYDSLGRYYERYATRVETGITYLNDKKIYDKNSNVTEFISFNRDGKINSKTVYFYDINNKLIKSEKYSNYFLTNNPPVKTIEIFEYKGEKLVKKTDYHLELNYSIITQYNLKGQEIAYRWNTLKSDSIIHYWETKSYYDGKKLIKTTYNDSDNLNHWTHYKYNSRNLPSIIYRVDKSSGKYL